MTIPTINPTDRHHDQPTAAKEQWINSLNDMITVHAWHDPIVEANPLAVPTNSSGHPRSAVWQWPWPSALPHTRRRRHRHGPWMTSR
jgi:hypothetical protein